MDIFDIDVESLKKARNSARNRTWYEANKERIAAQHKAYYEANKEKVAARHKAYRQANKEQRAAQQKAYYEANKEQIAARKKARRFRKTTVINYLLVQQRGRCATCFNNVIEKHHLDHIVPLAKGGTNDRSNFQLLCPTCNLKKSAKDPLAFMQERGKLC